MRSIRESFLSAWDTSVALAHSLTYFLMFGERGLAQHLKDYGDVDFFIGVGHPEDSRVSLKMKVSEVLQLHKEHPTAVEEMVHARLVQQWHDFLESLYVQLVKEHLVEGKHHPGLETMSVKVDFRDPGDLAEDVARAATQQFAYSEAPAKLRTVAAALDVEIPTALSESIRKHVAVRNVLQHNEGVLRDVDLRFLGREGSYITLQNNSDEPAATSVGERVKVTFWELVAVRNHFRAAALQLVPNED